MKKDITIDIVKRIKNLLEELGARVVLTRDDDYFVGLRKRVDITQRENLDLFISIHHDAFDTDEVRGITSYYYHLDDEGIAKAIHENIFKEDIGTRDRGVLHEDYFVLSENTVPAVLLELGYITNAEDENLLKSEDFQKEVSARIVSGIVDYFEKP